MEHFDIVMCFKKSESPCSDSGLVYCPAETTTGTTLEASTTEEPEATANAGMYAGVAFGIVCGIFCGIVLYTSRRRAAANITPPVNIAPAVNFNAGARGPPPPHYVPPPDANVPAGGDNTTPVGDNTTPVGGDNNYGSFGAAAPLVIALASL